jgi:hypothetical protein
MKNSNSKFKFKIQNSNSKFRARVRDRVSTWTRTRTQLYRANLENGFKLTCHLVEVVVGSDSNDNHQKCGSNKDENYSWIVWINLDHHKPCVAWGHLKM